MGRTALSCGLLSTFSSPAVRSAGWLSPSQKLVVYQKAVTFADACCSLTKDFPRGYFFLADQLNRTALSIAANIAEGNGRFTKPDRRNFFTIRVRLIQNFTRTFTLGKLVFHPMRW